MGKIVTAIVLFVFSTGLACASQGLTIVALKSKGIPAEPYEAALLGFTDRLNSRDANARITEHHLKSGKEEDLLALLRQIESRKPDLVLTLGTPTARFAQERIRNIPVVFTMVLNPEKSGISLSGVSMDIPYETMLKNLKDMMPDRVKIGLVYSAQSDSLYKEVREATLKLDLKLVAKKIDSEKEFPTAIEALFTEIDWFLMLPDPHIYFPKSVEHLLRESLRRACPIIGLSSAYTRAGALISFDCNYTDLGEQTADVALSILAQEKPPKTEVIGPRKITFSLNLLVAERLRITIPSETIKQANEVFGK